MRASRTIGLGLVGFALAASTATGQDAKALYDKRCKVCHTLHGESGKQAEKGGPLDGVGAKRDRAWLEKYLRDPKSAMPDAKMPKLKMSDEELKTFVDYMAGLK